MPWLKKVDANQFTLTDEQKELIRSRETVYFENEPVRWNGGEQFLVSLRKGEGFVRVLEGQWFIKHPEGYWEVLWPDQFDKLFQPTS